MAKTPSQSVNKNVNNVNKKNVNSSKNVNKNVNNSKNENNMRYILHISIIERGYKQRIVEEKVKKFRTQINEEKGKIRRKGITTKSNKRGNNINSQTHNNE